MMHINCEIYIKASIALICGIQKPIVFLETCVKTIRTKYAQMILDAYYINCFCICLKEIIGPQVPYMSTIEVLMPIL